jgi:hypothetical protein
MGDDRLGIHGKRDGSAHAGIAQQRVAQLKPMYA